MTTTDTRTVYVGDHAHACNQCGCPQCCGCKNCGQLNPACVTVSNDEFMVTGITHVGPDCGCVPA